MQPRKEIACGAFGIFPQKGSTQRFLVNGLKPPSSAAFHD